MESKNYAVINGKKIELTDEQLKAIGYAPKKDYAEMFERKIGDYYYLIDSTGEVAHVKDQRWHTDDGRYNSANYCSDEGIMLQRALHETLNRFLWRASVSAGEIDRPWDGSAEHYLIYKAIDGFRVWPVVKDCCSCVYFPSEQSAMEAIVNIIEPFIKEHPDFKW